MSQQQLKSPDRSKFVFKPRTIEEIRADDFHSNSFSDIDKYDRDIVVDNYAGTVQTIRKWRELETLPELLSNIDKSQYQKVRKIQATVIPLILAGHDLKVQAETGAGKSAAFLVPIIHSIIAHSFENLAGDSKYNCNFNRPKALIIEPSRELAIQVFEQAMKLADNTGVKVSICFGEFDYGANAKLIWDSECDILVGTIGRLSHFCKEGVISNKELKFLVLDEADLFIMDKSFDDILAITKLSNFPENVQTLMFSATYPKGSNQHVVKMLKHSFLYVHNDLETPLSSRICQDFIECAQSEKLEKLRDILITELTSTSKHLRIMVFVDKKRDVELIKDYLDKSMIPCLMLTANLVADSRIKTMETYRADEPPVVIATDLVARGMDIKDLDVIINYNMPTNISTYVHRIGRTGRMKFGRAISLIDTGNFEDNVIIDELVAMLLNEMYTVPGWMSNMTKSVRLVNNRWICGFGNDSFGAGDVQKESDDDDMNPFSTLVAAYNRRFPQH